MESNSRHNVESDRHAEVSGSTERRREPKLPCRDKVLIALGGFALGIPIAAGALVAGRYGLLNLRALHQLSTLEKWAAAFGSALLVEVSTAVVAAYILNRTFRNRRRSMQKIRHHAAIEECNIQGSDAEGVRPHKRTDVARSHLAKQIVEVCREAGDRGLVQQYGALGIRPSQINKFSSRSQQIEWQLEADEILRDLFAGPWKDKSVEEIDAECQDYIERGGAKGFFCAQDDSEQELWKVGGDAKQVIGMVAYRWIEWREAGRDAEKVTADNKLDETGKIDALTKMREEAAENWSLRAERLRREIATLRVKPLDDRNIGE